MSDLPAFSQGPGHATPASPTSSKMSGLLHGSDLNPQRRVQSLRRNSGRRPELFVEDPQKARNVVLTVARGRRRALSNPDLTSKQAEHVLLAMQAEKNDDRDQDSPPPNPSPESSRNLADESYRAPGIRIAPPEVRGRAQTEDVARQRQPVLTRSVSPNSARSQSAANIQRQGSFNGAMTFSPDFRNAGDLDSPKLPGSSNHDFSNQSSGASAMDARKT